MLIYLDHALEARSDAAALRLYRAQRDGSLAREGVYARIRHPQDTGFALILTGFLLHWPTLLTLAMYPVLVVMYARLARPEERYNVARFGQEYRRYMQDAPAFMPRRRPTNVPSKRERIGFAGHGAARASSPDQAIRGDRIRRTRLLARRAQHAAPCQS